MVLSIFFQFLCLKDYPLATFFVSLHRPRFMFSNHLQGIGDLSYSTKIKNNKLLSKLQKQFPEKFLQDNFPVDIFQNLQKCTHAVLYVVNLDVEATTVNSCEQLLLSN